MTTATVDPVEQKLAALKAAEEAAERAETEAHARDLRAQAEQAVRSEQRAADAAARKAKADAVEAALRARAPYSEIVADSLLDAARDARYPVHVRAGTWWIQLPRAGRARPEPALPDVEVPR